LEALEVEQGLAPVVGGVRLAPLPPRAGGRPERDAPLVLRRGLQKKKSAVIRERSSIVWGQSVSQSVSHHHAAAAVCRGFATRHRRPAVFVCRLVLR
jgi:hypothetical protein